MMYGNHMGTGGWAVSIFVTLVVVAVLVAAVVWLAQNLRGDAMQRRDRAAQPGSARELLDRRLATGEITPEDHQRLREVLSDRQPQEPEATVPTVP